MMSPLCVKSTEPLEDLSFSFRLHNVNSWSSSFYVWGYYLADV